MNILDSCLLDTDIELLTECSFDFLAGRTFPKPNPISNVSDGNPLFPLLQKMPMRPQK